METTETPKTQTRSRITAEEFYALPEYAAHTLIQLIDGEVVIDTMAPPTLNHQDVVGEIFYLLKTIARQKQGKAYVAPTEVYLDAGSVFQPDVLYLKPGTACVVEEKRLVGAPDLVVEVLSPSTAQHDRGPKYAAYAKHGVAEYWIVDPAHRTLEVMVQVDGAGGEFRRMGAYGADDTFRSPLLDEALALSAVFGG